MGVAGMVRAMTPESVWIGAEPDPVGRVSTTYVGRSTQTQVLRAELGSSNRNHWTGWPAPTSTSCSGEPTTNSAGRSRPQRRMTGSAL